MCIDRIISEFTTTKPIVVWKKVRRTKNPNVFISGILCKNRTVQDGYRTTGRCLKYEVGKMTKSPIPKTAGVYVYTSRVRSNPNNIHKFARIKCVIPARTKVRCGIIAFCASRIKVLAGD